MKSVDATIHIVQRCTIAPFFVSQSNNTAEYHLQCKGMDYFLYKQEKPRIFFKKNYTARVEAKKALSSRTGLCSKKTLKTLLCEKSMQIYEIVVVQPTMFSEKT